MTLPRLSLRARLAALLAPEHRSQGAEDRARAAMSALEPLGEAA